jgi:ornithine cyclodeaminase
LKWPIRDGLIGEDHIHAEVGELISGAKPGRTSAEQITLYKSVGVAVQDAVAAHLVLEAAEKQGAGREVEI